jgi:hypothetical protein
MTRDSKLKAMEAAAEPTPNSIPSWVAKQEDLSRALGRLPVRIPPPGLTTSLRVIASRERQRTMNRMTFRRKWETWCDRVRLSATNVMRPLALPLAGGIVSAVVLFSMWVVPTYPVLGKTTSDVPTILTTAPAVKGTAAMGVAGGDVVVDVTVDDQGRMVDYTILRGPRLLHDAALRRRLENMLLFTQFVPATEFGKPVPSKLRLSLFSSYINVKG